MFKKRRFVLLLVVLFVFVVSLAACIVHTEPQPQQITYDYFDVSSHPSQMHLGENATVLWMPSRDLTQVGKEAIIFSVLLVTPQRFRQELCGAFTSSYLLDQVGGDNVSGRSYLRPFQIPQHLKAGQYELVRQITRIQSRVSACAGLLVTIS